MLLFPTAGSTHISHVCSFANVNTGITRKERLKGKLPTTHRQHRLQVTPSPMGKQCTSSRETTSEGSRTYLAAELGITELLPGQGCARRAEAGWAAHQHMQTVWKCTQSQLQGTGQLGGVLGSKGCMALMREGQHIPFRGSCLQFTARRHLETFPWMLRSHEGRGCLQDNSSIQRTNRFGCPTRNMAQNKKVHVWPSTTTCKRDQPWGWLMHIAVKTSPSKSWLKKNTTLQLPWRNSGIKSNETDKHAFQQNPRVTNRVWRSKTQRYWAHNKHPS